MQAASTFLKPPGGIQGSGGAHTGALATALSVGMKAFVSDPEVSCLPASHETAKAHLLDCIGDKVSDLLQFLATNILSIFNFKHRI